MNVKEKRKKNLVKDIIHELAFCFFLLFCSFFISYVFDRIILKNLYEFFLLIYGEGNTIVKYLSHSVNFSWHRIYFFFIWFLLFGYILHYGKTITYRFRYLLASALLLLLVLGKFSGSSLGFYDGMLVDNTDSYIESTLLGIPQGIRGDEWATEKPYYFAQRSVDYDYYNNNLMLDGCDMVIHAFAPVKNIIILARPDLWGFLFLPNDYAFAFYWNLRILLLFMASFELGYMLTKSKKYGVIWALFVCFAPPIQWWLSQTFMIIVWSGEYFIVLFNKLLVNNRWKNKTIYVVLSAWSGIIYIMTMYPATQVPMAYIFAVLVVYVIMVNWREHPFNTKNIICYVFIIVLLLCFMGYYYHMSGTAMNILLDTNYPGKTRRWIELQWDYELLQFVNPFSWMNPIETINNCEASQYYSFMPFVIICLCFVTKEMKKNSKNILVLAYSLLAVCLFLWQISYMPQITWLNKITLLSYSYPIRILLAVGFGFTLILFVLLHYMESQKIEGNQLGIKALISYVLFAFTYSLTAKSNLIAENIREGGYLFIIIVVYAYLGFCIISARKKYIKKFILMYLCILFFSTAFINPITYGTDSMFEKTTMSKVREINAQEPGKWMVSGSPTISNLVTAQGVSRVTGTYYYPDEKMMEIIDPKHEYENMWNQYAHIDMRLTDDKNIISQFDYEQQIELDGVNRIIYVNLETAKELGINYIFTKYQIPDKYIEDSSVIKIYTNEIDGWNIFALK